MGCPEKPSERLRTRKYRRPIPLIEKISESNE
jgi:hypothetical protein